MISVPDQTIIWRYLDAYKFESLLSQGAMFFSRADRFSDPFEGSIPRREAENRIHEYRNQDLFFGRVVDEEANMRAVEQLANAHRQDKKHTVVSCWHINNRENDLMWRLYLSNNTGVAVQSTVGRLREALTIARQELYMSKVRYLDFDNDIWYDPVEFPRRGYNMLAPIIHKRMEFRDENEFRVFHSIPFPRPDNYWENQPVEEGMFVNMDLNVLIERIYFHPTAESITKERTRDLIESFQHNFECWDSQLQTAPYF